MQKINEQYKSIATGLFNVGTDFKNDFNVSAIRYGNINSRGALDVMNVMRSLARLQYIKWCGIL